MFANWAEYLDCIEYREGLHRNTTWILPTVVVRAVPLQI